MNVIQIVKFLEVLASASFLVWFFYGPWRRFVVELARQNLFELRDEVFMFAADGRIAFDDPNYVGFRNRINALIRFCEHYSFSALLASPTPTPSDASTLMTSLKAMPDRELANDIERRYVAALLLVFGSMIIRSAFWTLLTLILAPIVAVREMLRGVRDANRFVTRIEQRIEHDSAINSDMALNCA